MTYEGQPGTQVVAVKPAEASASTRPADVVVGDIALAEVPGEGDEAADPRTALEETALKRERLKHLAQHRELRKAFADRVWRFVCCYAGAALVLTVLDGFGLMSLSDVVLSTIVGSTAVSAIGLLYVITKNLFPDRNGRGDP